MTARGIVHQRPFGLGAERRRALKSDETEDGRRDRQADATGKAAAQAQLVDVGGGAVHVQDESDEH